MNDVHKTGTIGRIRACFATGVFLFRRKLALLEFQYRREREFRQRHPLIWRTPGQLLEMDLEHYEAETEEHDLSVATLEKLRSYRDAIDERLRRSRQVSLLMFVALVSNYFAIDSDLSFAFGIKAKFSGFREVFLVAMSFIGIYLLILQNNIYILNSYIKFIVKRLPGEVRQMHTASHFFSDNLNRYLPVNLPRIVPTPLNSRISMIPYLFGLFLLAAVLAVYSLMYFLIARDIWFNGNVGLWSKVSVALAVLNATLGLVYLATTRIPLPYRDFRTLDDLEVLDLIAPSQSKRLRDEMSAELIADYNRLIAKGYLDPLQGSYDRS